MKKPVDLDGQVYPSKKDLLAAVRLYVSEAPLNVPLWDTLPYAIFERHPHRNEKIGVGMKHIELRLTEFKNRGFYLFRTNGTRIDFSWRVALDFAQSGATLSSAAREAVRDQIAAVAEGNGTHVHHDGKPFRQLLNEWLVERGEDGLPMLIHGDLHDYFAFTDDARSWRDYHRKHAVLRSVSVEEHKRIHGRAL